MSALRNIVILICLPLLMGSHFVTEYTIFCQQDAGISSHQLGEKITPGGLDRFCAFSLVAPEQSIQEFYEPDSETDHDADKILGLSSMLLGGFTKVSISTAFFRQRGGAMPLYTLFCQWRFDNLS
ncbi:MAG: hypothetical protein IPN29_13080 [Saprospiraceae bacterium]|nr:hypothetical protein [Saprospiraceae bacterium]